MGGVAAVVGAVAGGIFAHKSASAQRKAVHKQNDAAKAQAREAEKQRNIERARSRAEQAKAARQAIAKSRIAQAQAQAAGIAQGGGLGMGIATFQGAASAQGAGTAANIGFSEGQYRAQSQIFDSQLASNLAGIQGQIGYNNQMYNASKFAVIGGAIDAINPKGSLGSQIGTALGKLFK